MLKNEITFSEDAQNFIWLDLLRGIAVIAIVIHHWLLFMPYQNSKLATFIHTIAGTFVHLFFVISGFGLTVAYFQRKHFSWKKWAQRRFLRLIIPYWIIITITIALVNLFHSAIPNLIPKNFSWRVLIAYLTFFRNFYSPAWELNPTFWFMPVILGLYLLFPICIKILEKFGVIVLLSICITITYASIYFFLEWSTTHQSALPLFHLAEFSLGMSLGYIQLFHFTFSKRLTDWGSFCSGLFLYISGWALSTFWKYGPSYNDLLTATGIYLIMRFIINLIIKFLPRAVIKTLSLFSKESYVIYLIHGPLILYLAKPLVLNLAGHESNPFLMIILTPIFCLIVFLVSKIISPPIYNLWKGIKNNK